MRTVFVSDLHLHPDPGPEEVEASRACAAFLRTAAGEDDGEVRIVLLGDTFDLAGGRVGSDPVVVATDRLERAAVDHREVVAALSDLVTGGVRVTAVTGNHDLALAAGPLGRLLRDIVAGPIDVVPWLLYSPGVAYAEHGSQYHDINAVARPWDPAGVAAAARPLAAAFEAAASARWRPGATVAAVAACGAWLCARRPGAADPSDGRLAEHAGGLGLRPGTLAELDAGAARSRARTVARLAGKLGGAGRPRGADPNAYLVAAMARADRVLGADRVPFYVCGHTHAAACVRLPSGAAYLNCGTWCSRRPTGATVRTAVVIEGGNGMPPSARLVAWRAGRVAVLAECSSNAAPIGAADERLHHLRGW